jgi:hypothetical protein
MAPAHELLQFAECSPADGINAAFERLRDYGKSCGQFYSEKLDGF